MCSPPWPPCAFASFDTGAVLRVVGRASWASNAAAVALPTTDQGTQHREGARCDTTSPSRFGGIGRWGEPVVLSVASHWLRPRRDQTGQDGTGRDDEHRSPKRRGVQVEVRSAFGRSSLCFATSPAGPARTDGKTVDRQGGRSVPASCPFADCLALPPLMLSCTARRRWSSARARLRRTARSSALRYRTAYSAMRRSDRGSCGPSCRLG